MVTMRGLLDKVSPVVDSSFTFLGASGNSTLDPFILFPADYVKSLKMAQRHRDMSFSV